jgi:hypothetical protein
LSARSALSASPVSSVARSTVDSPAQGPHADFGFGSWHAGVVQFLRADGSVTTLNPNMDEQIKRRLGHAQDGLITDLPP